MSRMTEDPWLRYLPALHRTLAWPEVEADLPRSFVGLDFEQTCAWWESLRYLFRQLLGWSDLPSGLLWWYRNGLDVDGDSRLRMVAERWNGRSELDYFAAREWESGGVTGMVEDSQEVPDERAEPVSGWWREFESRGPLAEWDPYHGGYNSLHLGHSNRVGWGEPAGAAEGWHDHRSRKARLVVSGFDSWQRELMEFGEGLPPVGEHSWRVEVFDRQVGFLGRFRQSRVTGRWFQGRHHLHMAGNSKKSIK